MKKSTTGGITQWTIALLTILILGLGFSAFYLSRKNGSASNNELPNTTPLPFADSSEGSLTNETFAALIEENLSELGFVKEITFKGADEGQFQD